ncbi:MAG TPA: LysR family transcriptional regulator [Burkholderiaceae bacterium]|nr:LysR family transcriptional regulator [Burkholderiaceae bacterium]
MKKTVRQRPLALDQLRTFDAVARRLSFSAAADELHLTQSAISRQIKALEEELGAPLFNRGTRRVELSAAGLSLRHTLTPMLEQLDRVVRDIRIRGGRPRVSVSTFASFASLWLMPRLAAFQKANPDFDIRLSATDHMTSLDDPEQDVVLRYCEPELATPIAERMFGELITPVASPHLLAQSRAGAAPPLEKPADVARHTLLEEDDPRPSTSYQLSWRRWLDEHGMSGLQPQRWLYLNFTYQQVQGALAGQGIALARLALVHDLLAGGELVELFDGRCRIAGTYGYYLIQLPLAQPRPELERFMQWARAEAAATRRALGEADPLPDDG